MINQLHARFHRPQDGWDPVPMAHAAKYADAEWAAIDERLIDIIEKWIGGFAGKRVLDLGAGPGQYSVAFARRGASVTWHDVSNKYQDYAREKALQFNVSDQIHFSLGYMDHAADMLPDRYDLIFNRICWCYSMTDDTFADMLYGLVAPGGFAYVDTTHSAFRQDQLSLWGRGTTWLNSTIGFKVGHPHPPRGRIAKLFMRHPLRKITVDYGAKWNDRIWFEKSALA